MYSPCMQNKSTNPWTKSKYKMFQWAEKYWTLHTLSSKINFKNLKNLIEGEIKKESEG